MPLLKQENGKFLEAISPCSSNTVLEARCSQCKFKQSKPREIFEEMLKKKHEHFPMFSCSDLTNLPKLRCLLSLGTGTWLLLIRVEEMSYL